jgi:mRNA interferase HigB
LTQHTRVYHIGNHGFHLGNHARKGAALRIISRRALRDFADKHADARVPLDAWYQFVRSRAYESPHELRQDFPTASFLGARRTVFNIAGNRYRLVVDMRYDLGRVYVRHVLTHADYDRRSIEGTL